MGVPNQNGSTITVHLSSAPFDCGKWSFIDQRFTPVNRALYTMRFPSIKIAQFTHKMILKKLNDTFSHFPIRFSGKNSDNLGQNVVDKLQKSPRAPQSNVGMT